MRCIISENHNPYFNLAAEEYLLKNSTEEVFILYINEPCVVVGKHQNLLSEINHRYIYENDIKLARRISGGGTVYQDFNNLNFSFIHNCPNLEQANFRTFTLPILTALREMKIEVDLSERNDLLIADKKISGNAMHIYKTRVLSHGTLLFNTDLNHLSNALNNVPEKYTDKSIKSVKSKVTNILEHLVNPQTMNQFSRNLFQNILELLDKPVLEPITNLEANKISEISKEKYASWEWVFGYSPKYTFSNIISQANLNLRLKMQIEKGIIINVEENIDGKASLEYHDALEKLTGARHEFYAILALLMKDNCLNRLEHFNVEEFCHLLF